MWQQGASQTLGIDVGAVSVKVCGLRAAGELCSATVAHEGDLEAAVAASLAELGLPPDAAPLTVATGGSGRYRLCVPEVIAARATEAALAELGLRPRAVVALGGEDLVVYGTDAEGRVRSCYAGNKCASGTGEFFRQQLGRMGLGLGDLDAVAEHATALELSARCSVFLKSDCTHRLNKGEATKGDIALSLSRVMAQKVGEYLTKARIRSGQVVLTGGVTRNRHLLRFLAQGWPEVQFLVPSAATFFEALGAARLARELGRPLPARAQLIAPRVSLDYGALEPLSEATGLVRTFPSRRGPLRDGASYVLGVDGGSTTTKVALVDAETLDIVASHYGRTHGDPVAALKQCIAELRAQLGDRRVPIELCATTGSSRELLGVFLETDGVYNEIIAHSVGTAAFDAEVDTIFEIGGQDAKYVLLANGVPIDYAMNEACSAGTGSFLEESAAGDLDISAAEDIGPAALAAQAPLRFGEHCSAFINSDVRKAIQQGAKREDIVAGLVCSIVANYLNRVVGNRTVGARVALQGGVAKNPAVPLAFAQRLGKPIVVPPDPELMGCYGVARLALRRHQEGKLAKGQFELDVLLDKPIVVRGEIVCRSCENRCPIRLLEVGGRRYPFGGRCSKFTRARRRGGKRLVGTDHVAWRSDQLFKGFVPDPATFVARDWRTVGVPRALSVHSLWPLYATYFHELGVRAVLSERVSPEGVARQESSYCYPVEIAHGAIQDLRERGVDFLFLPHFRDMPTLEQGKVHACVCPLTQGLPYFARQAFDLPDERVLKPVVSFKHGWDSCRPELERIAVQLGQTPEAGARAFERGLERQRAFAQACRRRGRELRAEIEAHPERLYVALLGRPYNAFTRDANMGIPRKLASRGVSVVPFDLIYDTDSEIFPNMYWHYGQLDMRAVRTVEQLPNLYLTWISNFSCAPDSFMLHYLRWMMGDKPFLVLEIDSHTADAGLDTRIEAFLDVIEGYRRKGASRPPSRAARRYRLERVADRVVVRDLCSDALLELRDPRVTMVWPSMGDIATEAVAACARRRGVRSVAMPVPDARSTQLARDVASGKECIPALLVLGSMLSYLRTAAPSVPDEVRVIYVPSTLGPCRTGQYHVFYDKLLEELGFEDVVLMVGESESSYGELGGAFTRDLWRAVVLADAFTDMRSAVRLLARNPEEGLRTFEQSWRVVLEAMEQGEAALDRALEAAARSLAALPRRATMAELKKVIVVGEIYVRRDTFSVRELSEHLVGQGILPKLADTAEWIHYTDWAQAYLLDAERRRSGGRAALRWSWLRARSWLEVERLWKHAVEHRIRRVLGSTGLLPASPPDVGSALAAGSEHFVSPELESEATLSPAVAAAAMGDGYSGVAIIAPFGCLPGRLIEGVFAPWAKARGLPVVALENDGQPYPPNVVSRIELFAHDVKRYQRKPSEAR